MLTTDIMKEKLQSALSVKRYIHTMGVAEEANEISRNLWHSTRQKKKQK